MIYHSTKIRLPDTPNWQQIKKIPMTSQFTDRTSSPNFFEVAVFLLSNSATPPSFMSISILVLELRQSSFIRDWPEIQESEIPSEFCYIPGDWRELEMLNLVQTSLIESYWMQENVRVTTFTVSKLFRKNQQGKFTLPLRLVLKTEILDLLIFSNFVKLPLKVRRVKADTRKRKFLKLICKN